MILASQKSQQSALYQKSIPLKIKITVASRTSLLTTLHNTKVHKIALGGKKESQPLFCSAVICSAMTTSLARNP